MYIMKPFQMWFFYFLGIFVGTPSLCKMNHRIALCWKAGPSQCGCCDRPAAMCCTVDGTWWDAAVPPSGGDCRIQLHVHFVKQNCVTARVIPQFQYSEEEASGHLWSCILVLPLITVQKISSATWSCTKWSCFADRIRKQKLTGSRWEHVSCLIEFSFISSSSPSRSS